MIFVQANSCNVCVFTSWYHRGHCKQQNRYISSSRSEWTQEWEKWTSSTHTVRKHEKEQRWYKFLHDFNLQSFQLTFACNHHTGQTGKLHHSYKQTYQSFILMFGFWQFTWMGKISWINEKNANIILVFHNLPLFR